MALVVAYNVAVLTCPTTLIAAVLTSVALAVKAVPTVNNAVLTLVVKFALVPVIAPVASIELAEITNLAVVLPNSCPDEFEAGTIDVALIVKPEVVCAAALTVPVVHTPVAFATTAVPTLALVAA